MLCHVPDTGWVLAEALGVGNSDICAWTRFHIRQRIWWQRGILHGKWSAAPELPGINRRENVETDPEQANAA